MPSLKGLTCRLVGSASHFTSWLPSRTMYRYSVVTPAGSITSPAHKLGSGEMEREGMGEEGEGDEPPLPLLPCNTRGKASEASQEPGKEARSQYTTSDSERERETEQGKRDSDRGKTDRDRERK